ncbi:MAG TPA: hypothetical protein VML19_17640 [Verrucomicrobiae bacterium]|nr:hypothetical protein [Verrucomicrobiae bacterium]
MSRRGRLWGCAVLLLCGAAWAQNPNPPQGRGRGGARFLGAEAGVPGPVVKNAPYSAEITTEISQSLPDGNRIHEVSPSRVFRDSEGRARREQSLAGLGAIAPNSNLPTVVFLQDPVAGTSYALDTVHRTATRSEWTLMGRRPGQKGPGPAPARGPGGGGRRGPAPDVSNVKTESLGRQTMEGVPVDGTRITTVIPAGQIGNEQPIQIVTERWYSPDLQIYILVRHSDPRSGETVTRVTNLSRGEPPKALFEVPADYKVVDGPPRPGGGAK